MPRLTLFSIALATTLWGYSATDIQYLYGHFEGPTFLDTQSSTKQTVTLEHYRTWDYGDLYTFADYTYAPNELRFSGDKKDLYGEISPRLSLNKVSEYALSDVFFKEWYAAFQYNGSSTYHAWLYGAGVDLNIPGFAVFGVNLYRKIQNIDDDTYQLSLNYYAPLSERCHFEGFFDWTTRDFLTQNQLLFDLSPIFTIKEGKLEVGTEWHFYHENSYKTENDVFQAMIKYTF